ncbi:MAG: tRNA pseudouridine(55) synthase TruB [Bacteroidia bacterium]|nr:tRNA pseudouridine(55) synthase TruB [Bacteroidia bacterium]
MNTPFNFVEGEVLLVDKPLTWTSFDVVNKLRYAILKKLETRRIKVGHAGTLDPLASGLLVICTGKLTKEIERYQAQEKEYEGEFLLGQTTPSYDAETEVDQTFETAHISPALIQTTLEQFRGEIQQVPPVFSAIKVDGKRLYKQARKGREIIIDPRPVYIHEFEITEMTLPRLKFRVVCSKGTYIRSLAHDFGQALGSGAYLSALCRTRIGAFRLQDAYVLPDLVALIQNAPNRE